MSEDPGTLGNRSASPPVPLTVFPELGVVAQTRPLELLGPKLGQPVHANPFKSAPGVPGGCVVREEEGGGCGWVVEGGEGDGCPPPPLGLSPL